MTTSEVRRAFENLVEPDWALAEAAAARQRIDLAWGAVLTRFLTVECGSERQVLSAGRVQTPTLRLAADRQRDREDFVPRPFWNVVLVTGDPPFEASAVGGPFWDESGARALVALAGLGDTAKVQRIERREQREPPPAPFNTTSFLAHASRLGHSASRAMAAAQELYVRGEISYPRTDNTVYPPSLPVREILDRLRKSPYQDYVERLLERPELEASHGPIHTTDHPPIHPTAAPAKRRAGVRASVYDMIARRYRRQYVSGRSIRTTAAGRALVDALTIYGPDVTDPGMTQHLEDRMTAIAEGRTTLAEVVDESRRDLHEVLAELRAHQPSLVRWLRDATFLEKDYGPCDACPDGRMVRRRARNGWSFLGCSRFPACRNRLRLSALGQRLPCTRPEAVPEAMGPSPATASA